MRGERLTMLPDSSSEGSPHGQFRLDALVCVVILHLIHRWPIGWRVGSMTHKTVTVTIVIPLREEAETLLTLFRASQFSRLFKRLRIHGFIKTVGQRCKYDLTVLGRTMGTAAVKLCEIIIPILHQPETA